MLELVPWFISGLAVLLAVIPIPGFDRLRFSAAIVALGAGQIYVAVLAFLLLLLVENNWHIRLVHSSGAIISSALLLSATLILTALQPTDLRTFSELAQLGLYVLLFVLLSSYLKNGRDLFVLLSACVWASVCVAFLALIWITMGWVVQPHIFSGRGSNEMSVFLALLGVVPCAVMITRKRNPLYLLAVALIFYVQYLATSRSSMAVSGIVLLVAGFFWTRLLIVRFGMVVGGIVILFRNVPQLRAVYEAQLNFSARERVALLDYGWDLALEKFWTGWGWGSTSRLASAAPNTAQNYPHFHNTYIQMLVELGLVGWIILGAGFWMATRWLSIAVFEARQAALIALVACSTLGIAIAGLFDAMLFGADRASQVVILLALCSRACMIVRQTAKVSGDNLPTPSASREAIRARPEPSR